MHESSTLFDPHNIPMMIGLQYEETYIEFWVKLLKSTQSVHDRTGKQAWYVCQGLHFHSFQFAGEGEKKKGKLEG